MSFVEQEDIINTFEGLIKHIFKNNKNIDLPEHPAPFGKIVYGVAGDLVTRDGPRPRSTAGL